MLASCILHQRTAASKDFFFLNFGSLPFQRIHLFFCRTVGQNSPYEPSGHRAFCSSQSRFFFRSWHKLVLSPPLFGQCLVDPRSLLSEVTSILLLAWYLLRWKRVSSEDVFILHIEDSQSPTLIVCLSCLKECMRTTEAERKRERFYALAYCRCSANSVMLGVESQNFQRRSLVI